MKKVLGMIFIGLAFVVSNGYAHCGKCGVGDAPAAEDAQSIVSQKVEKLTKELDLNEEQKTKVQALIQDKMDKKHQIMEEKQKAMDALHEDFKAKLKEVLSEEQMKKWEEMKSEAGGMKGHCPMCMGGKMCDMCLRKNSYHDHGQKSE